MSAKKPFKETKVGEWITSNAPGLISVVEKFVPAPIAGGLSILKKLISDDSSIPDDKKLEFARLADEHELAMIKEENDLEKARLEADRQDRADTRNREIQIATSDKAPLINKVATPVLALLISIAFFWLLAYLCKYSVPESNRDILNIMLGSLGTAWLGVVGYYFHSSLGSKQKEETISRMMRSK